MLSIGIPVYNGARTLAACLDSVRAQTYGDWHAVCVDDGSTDDTPEILADYARRDPRIAVVRQDNAGLGAARNAALAHFAGDYYQFLDADDVLHPSCAACAVNVLNGAKVDVALFKHRRFAHRPPAFGPVSLLADTDAGVPFQLFMVDGDDDRRAFIARPPMAWNRVTRASFWRAQGFTYPTGLLFEDNPVHWHMGLTVARYAFLDAALYGYRQTPGSLVNATDARAADIADIYALIGRLVHDAGRDALVPFWRARAAGALYRRYATVDAAHRAAYRARIRAAFSADELRALADAPDTPAAHRAFIRAAVDEDGRALARIHRRQTARRWWYRHVPPAWRERAHTWLSRL